MPIRHLALYQAVGIHGPSLKTFKIKLRRPNTREKKIRQQSKVFVMRRKKKKIQIMSISEDEGKT